MYSTKRDNLFRHLMLQQPTSQSSRNQTLAQVSMQPKKKYLTVYAYDFPFRKMASGKSLVLYPHPTILQNGMPCLELLPWPHLWAQTQGYILCLMSTTATPPPPLKMLFAAVKVFCRLTETDVSCSVNIWFGDDLSV